MARRGMARRGSRYGDRHGVGYSSRRGWGRRREPVPLYVYPDYEGGAFLYAVGAVLRWVWRYRSELAPVYWTAGMMVTGAWLHAVHPSWWPVPATVAGVAAMAGAGLASGPVTGPIPGRVGRFTQRVRARVAGWLMARFGMRLLAVLAVLARWPRLARRGVRVWVLAVVGSIAGWLTAATIAGVSAGPLRVLAMLAMAGLGAPWWWNNDRRRLVRIRRVMERFPDTAERARLDGAQMVSAEIGRYGWAARLRLRRGQHARNAIDAIPALGHAAGRHPASPRSAHGSARSASNRCRPTRPRWCCGWSRPTRTPSRSPGPATSPVATRVTSRVRAGIGGRSRTRCGSESGKTANRCGSRCCGDTC